MKFRYFVILAGFALVAGAARAQDPAAQPASNPVIRSETKLVLVDAVVTDKKGNYLHDLTAKDFKVFEDNKEQTITSFSFEAGANAAGSQRRYLVLFFDNSTIGFGEQAQARDAAFKFIDNNAGPNRAMAVVNYSGGLQIAQNFTEDPELLKSVVRGVKTSAVSPNGDASLGPKLSATYADFGARDVILALRSFAKNLATVPGRKTLVLLTAGFPVHPEMIPEIKATIDVCNKANVAIYPIDVRGLVAPGGSAPRGMLFAPPLSQWGARIVPAGFQRGTPPSAPSPGSPGRAPGPSSPGSPGGRGPGSSPGSNPGSTGNRGGGGTTNPNMNPGMNPLLNGSNRLIHKWPDSATTNQALLYMLADGTGGFVIVNTNDLLGGMEKIGKEQNEYYLLGYTPPEAKEGACHELKVKVEHVAANVRARTGYCDTKPRDLLAGASVEKTLESRAAAADAGNTHASLAAPFFYTSPNVARVNVAMEIAVDKMKFEKEKGKLNGAVNLLGIAYRPDGSVAARFSDTVKRSFENKKEMEEAKDQPLHYENQFDIGPGLYTLKVAFSSGGESFGKVETPLSVDPYDGSQFMVSSIVVTRDAKRVGDTMNGDDSLLLEDRRPLVAQGVQFVPQGSPRFKATDRPVVYVEVYEPLMMTMKDDKPPTVAMQIKVLDRKTGAEKGDTGPFRLDVKLKAGNPAIPIGFKLPGDSFPTGAYRIELRAYDEAGKTFTRTADFDVE